MLLIHSINAAASAFEMKPIFERLVGTRPLFLVDLPGFGLSDRSERVYDVRLYTDAILVMLEVIAERAGDAPVHVLALSLSSEFAARAADERKERFRSLTLITPTGFSRGSHRLRQPGKNREIPGFSALIERRPWAKPLFDLLTKESSVRYFLRRTYGSKDVDEDMVAYDVLSARQPGAHRAPLSFLSGRLFSRDVRSLYEALELPVWVPHGTRGDFKDFSESGWAEARPNWRFEPFASGALPHFERSEEFAASMNEFLARA